MLPEGKAELVEGQKVMVDELILIIRVIVNPLLADAFEVEVKCDQDSTKLE